jgi:hypothetical protein
MHDRGGFVHAVTGGTNFMHALGPAMHALGPAVRHRAVTGPPGRASTS